MRLLDVQGLSIRFGGVRALHDLSFTVDQGSFVGLMGPNGAGKTTVINCLSGIYKATSGSARFGECDVLKMRAHQVAEMGMARTFQDLGFFAQVPEMSVLDYVKLGRLELGPSRMFRDALKTRRSMEEEIRLKSEARKILGFFRDIREQLEPAQSERGYPILYGREGFPDLIDVENSSISTLSFAWRRRLDLARALVSRPKLLLLDEPAQGLPPTEIENLGKILKLVQKEFGVSALIVEHNVSMLMEISDKIVVMNFGEKIAEGTPAEVNSNAAVHEIYLGKSVASEKPQESSAKERSRSEVLLEVKNLDLYYGQARALSSVNIKLFPKQIACVLGTNGSGKSSLLKAISGIEKPAEGEICVKGEYLPLGWPEIAVERGIQYVPQGHVIFPRLTVRQNLEIGTFATIKKEGKRSIDRALAFFPELKRVLDLQANNLSGGQRQMLAIGQAIIGRPDVLLLDEPSLGLSPRFVEDLFNTIEKISREEDCSILLVEQNVTKALEISDYVFMMNSGVLISEGTAASYRNNISTVKKSLGFM